jgi:acyl-CoA synthetase (AMP-forming)/AMP-acid ligase II
VANVEFNLALVHETVAAAVPDRPCLVWGERRLSYAEVTDRSRRLAHWLQARGLGSHRSRRELEGHQSGQDHLGLYLYNGNEYLEAMLGAYKARVAPFNVNYRYVEEELRYLLANACTRGLVYHSCFAPTLAAVLPDVDGIDVLLQVADDSGNDLLPGALDYEAALASISAQALADAPLRAEPSPDDLYVLYTGGTTGMPKGVLWRQHDIFMAAMGGRAIGSWEELTSYEEIATRAAAASELRSMLLPPLMHGAAQWTAFVMMTRGGTLVLPSDTRNLDPADVWRTVERERANSITVVGDAMARPLIEELERGHYDVGSLFYFGNGGAALNPVLKERLLERLPALRLSDSVGSSETGAQMTHVSEKGAVATGRFDPGPGTVVVSEDLSRVLGPDDDEIGWLAQAGQVPLGYLEDAPKTARTFPTIGGSRYSVPGDRARVLADGQIELLGRDAVTINSGGEKIFAEEVEQAISGHRSVADVVVVGRPSERWGQEVVALVRLAEGSTPTVEELLDHAATHIARYKLPKAIAFLADLHRSPSGKADYRWAAEQARQLG